MKLNTSYKHHLLVALIIAVWLVLFLVLIAPFDIAEVPFSVRLEIMPLYGLISFISYMMLIPIQNFIFKKLGKWTLFLEIVVIVLFNVIVLMGSYTYYKSGIINGEFPFTKFTFEVYYPIFLIILPILLFTRWFLSKKAVEQNSDKIILTGENKLDVLQIHLSDLVCISSADNYVEIAYLIKNELHKKLLRITLKNVHPQVPSLLKTHRSYLINPLHFKDWKNSSLIRLTQLEVPVSKNYKKDVFESLNHSSLKASNSPQSH
ncbi:LytTR family DNA-binding domain-containing protein [Maribacter algarum]|uniref:LytTR family DNA-binding domain-containing protein n=1 Tax=Maribacter algarum (ex Zhang et al. 2020) TaxID=2578118 RepID=UPI001485E541|nr:LytTR family DNA-binding domain-containing protein [Maribacter algarum]